MKLSIPTNWQPGFLDEVDTSRVCEIYGKLEKDAVGGGRPSFAGPKVTLRQLESFIKDVHTRGLQFNYLLNAVCLGNSEWTRAGQRAIRTLLDRLCGVEVDSVTVALPFLLRLVKKRYPRLKVKVSVCADITGPLQAKSWEDLGADELSLSPWTVNRNFSLLGKIRRSVRCSLQVYANTRCLSGCPFIQYHYSSLSHASSSNRSAREFFLDYCRYSCRLITLREPWRLLTCAWIRPEDMRHYAHAGVSTLKLSERGIKTEYISRIVKAYTQERYHGNLLDLIPSAGQELVPHGKASMKKVRFFFRPLQLDLVKLWRGLSAIPAQEPFLLDNGRLEGFLEFFLQGRCTGNCAECGYCRQKADIALTIDENKRQHAFKAFRDFNAAMIDSGFFRMRCAAPR